MKRIFLKIGKVVLFIGLFIGLIFISSFVGEKIFQVRFFKTLPDFAFVDDNKPQACPIHTQTPCNAPILVNINTGNARPLRLYNTYATNPIQIRKVEKYGYMSLASGSGWSGAAFPDNHYVSVNISRKDMFEYSSAAAEHFFCEECLAKIEELKPTSNFIIVDGYELSKIKVYDLEEIESKEGINIRHYSFTLEEKDYDRYSFEMHSSYYEGGSTLDYLDSEDTSEYEKFYDYENLPKPNKDNDNS